MTTDSYFRQGAGHTVCQDYALSGENNDLAFALVADGCSSSPKTDVGARLVAESFVRSAVELYKYPTEVQLMGSPSPLLQVDTVGRLKTIKNLLTLSSNSFDSTLLATIYDKVKGRLSLFLWGDGFVVLKYDDHVEILKIDYKANAPCYLSYMLNSGRYNDYKTQFPDNDATLFLTTAWATGADSHEETIQPFHHQFVPTEGLRTIALFTDGIGTFSKVDEHHEAIPVPWNDVLFEASDFKSETGEFVQRRMLAMAKKSARMNRSHYDDVSAAAISFV